MAPFSAVRFLEDQPRPPRAPLRLADWPLLALRLLALLLLVAAFAWPYLRGADTLPVKESRVYILDNTLSHQAAGGFQRARDRILSDLARTENNVQIGVVELTSAPRVAVAMGDSRETAKAKVRSLEPSHQRGSYLAAFRLANNLLSNSLGEQKQIVFLGDSQENQWSEQVNTPPFLGGTKIEVASPPAAMLPNLSLSDPRVQRVFLGDKSLIHFTVKLTHLGPATTGRLVLRANGQTVLSREVDLEKQPETVLVQTQWDADAAEWLTGEVSIEGAPDALADDNRVFFSLAPVVEGKVALLAQSHYLRVALSPEVTRGHWAAQIIDPTRLSGEMTEPAAADVLCIESHYLQSAGARKLLQAYLSNGRGVVLFVNRVTPAVKGCLRDLGFEVETAVEAGKETPEKFQFAFFNHPVLHPFLSPDYGNLMDIRVWQYFRLNTREGLPLVFSEKGSPLLFQGTKHAAKLFVIGFGMDRTQTSWPVHQTFIPFLDLVLQAARAEDSMPTTFEPAEVATLQVPGVAAREVVVRQSERELARVPVEQGRAQIRLPDAPGTYALSYDRDPQIQRMVNVNCPAKESQLAYSADPETLKLWRQDGRDAVRAPRAGQAVHASVAAILQQRCWWWLVLGGIAALTLEMALAEGRRQRT